MKHIILIVCVGWLIGCTADREARDVYPTRIIFQQPLPQFPKSLGYPVPKLELALLINEDGSVKEAYLVRGSGDAEWDRLAQSVMLNWKFAPIYKNNKPAQTWIRLKANIKFEEPVILTLAEIICTTKVDADSIYKALEMGKDFGELALKYSFAPSKENRGYVGKLDINSYPREIKEALLTLSPEKHTQPLQYGDNYIIFKRIKDE